MAKGLGKGLEALIPGWKKDEPKQEEPKEQQTDNSYPDNEAIQYIKLGNIRPNPEQPRNIFDEDKLLELSLSIQDKGVIQPIIVSRVEGGGFQIIAGERRYRASRLAGLTHIPAVVKKYNEDEGFEVALLENIQREDLNPIEEAEAYKYLIDNYNMKQEQLADKVSKSRSQVSNMLRLLTLSDEIKDEIEQGNISASQARTLLSVDEKQRGELFVQLLNKGQSVRELEQIVKQKKGKVEKKEDREIEIIDLEEKLIKKFLTKIKIDTKGKGKKIKGTIKISFNNLEDLERLIDLINN